jgi:RHS repeat-associated protein
VTDTYAYDAFGNVIARTGTTPNLYLFTGEQYDPDLGLYFLRARYQNTQTGRFWTLDNFEGNSGDPASLHKFLYVQAEPGNQIDPTGYFTLTETKLTIIISGVVNAAIKATQPGFFNKSAGEIFRDLGVSFTIGAAAGAVGVSVAGKLLLKAFGKIFAMALAGASSAFIAQSLGEITDFLINGKELTFQTVGCATARVGTATLAGLFMGGLLANVKITIPGRRVDYISERLPVPLQLTSYRDVINAPSAVGAGTGGLIVNALAYWFPFFEGCH